MRVWGWRGTLALACAAPFEPEANTEEEEEPLQSTLADMARNTRLTCAAGVIGTKLISPIMKLSGPNGKNRK